ncbi:MAG: type II toxin-antitoxin system VapC family toxin [Solirubrobacteraceae bacterium]
MSAVAARSGQAAGATCAYLDASAAVKLMIAEQESETLLSFLADWPLRISSELLRVELSCVCHRQGMPASDADELLSGIRLLPLTSTVLRSACEAFTPGQRALDALHLAAAEQAREQIGCFISYDSEQAAAASALGWQVASPAPAPEQS